MVEDISSLKHVVDQHAGTLFRMISQLEQKSNFSLDTKLMNLSVGELNQLLLPLTELKHLEEDIENKLNRAFAYAKKRHCSELSGDHRVIKRIELAALVTELLMIHDHKEGVKNATRSVWLSSTGDTACIREENTEIPYETPVQGKDDYYRTFYIDYRGNRVFTHKEYVWPNLRSDNVHEQLLIDDKCYDELTAFHKAESSEWHKEFFPLWTQLPKEMTNAKTNSKKLSKFSEMNEKTLPHSSEVPAKSDLHIQKGADDQLLLMADGLCGDLSHQDIEALLKLRPLKDNPYKVQRLQLHLLKGISLSVDDQTRQRLQTEIRLLLGMDAPKASAVL